MKKTLLLIPLVIAAVFLFTACPLPLTSGLPADLVLSLGRFNSTGGLTNLRAAVGGTIGVPVLITDQTGKAATAAYDVLFTLSVDADLETTADNTVVGTESVTAGTETVLALTVPATVTAAGTYYLFGAIDAADAAENNNTACIEVVLGTDNLPDLEISLSATPDWALPGGSMNIGFRIDNTGYAAVASGTAILVEFTVNLGGADNSMGESTITLTEALYPQDFVTGLAAVEVPDLTSMATDDGVPADELGLWSDGVYTATVDPDDAIDEVVEGGTDTFTIFSGNTFPDLVMSDIILPDSFEAAKIGSPVELTLKIANNGAAATGDYTIDLYVDIDTNGAYDAATDLMLKQWTSEETPVVPYDPTGSGYNVVYINTRNLDIVYPEVTEGSYTIRGEVIPNEGMTEYDDTNNAAAEGGIAFVESLADLSMKRMSSTLASAIAEADGGTITLSYILTNEGTEDATGSFSVAFYATEDDVIDTGTDISLGSDALTDVTIAARGFLSDSFTAAFPAGQGAGFYTVYWVIDSGGAVSEANETNNQPSSVDECYVFPFVSDGITDITARVLAYKPQGVAATYCDVRMYAYNDVWAQTAYASGGTTNPGTLYSSNLQMTLGSGDTVGLRFREWGYTNIPIAFIVVPEYVAGYGAGGIPSALNGQDSYEPNNDTTTAYALSGSANPLFGFLVILIDASTDASDYFTFTVP